MERTGIDRRPGMEVPVKKSKRTSRFEYLARSGPAAEALLTSSSMTLAAFIAVALLYGCDGRPGGGWLRRAKARRAALGAIGEQGWGRFPPA
jgi:hypothetical protein